MAIVLDIIIVGVFLLSVWLGWKRGFIKSLTGLVAFAAALGVALWLSTPIAQWTYDAAVEPVITTAIEETQHAALTTPSSVDEMVDALPDGVRALLSAAGIDLDGNLIEQLSPDNAAVTADQLVSDVIEPMIVSIFRAVAMLLLFVITVIVMSLLMKVVDKVLSSLPLLKGANRLLGVIPGAVNGVISVFIAVTLIQLLCSFDILITPEAIQNSALIGWLNSMNFINLNIG